MDQRRIRRFKKMLAFVEKQRDVIQLELANQRTVITEFENQKQKLSLRLERALEPANSSLNVATNRQLISQTVISLQQQIRATDAALEIAEKQLSQIIDRYQKQNSKVKSWEKLVERKLEKILQHQSRREFVEADDRYLNTRN